MKERTIGICPACTQPVLDTDEDVVWTCKHNLSHSNPFALTGRLRGGMNVSETTKKRHGDYSDCPYDHNNMLCPNEMPLHSACYDRGNY